MAEIDNIQRRLLNKATKEPDFSRFIGGLEIDLFDGNRELATIYSSLSEYYKEHKEPVTKDLLDTYVQHKLDRQKVPENERSPYVSAIGSVFTVDSAKDEQVFDEIISKHIESRRVMNAIKMVALNGGDAKAIEKFDATYLKIKKETYTNSKSTIIDVMDKDNGVIVSEYIDDIDAGLVDIPVVPYQQATGGLSKGELALIGADSGMGKSLAMVSLAVEYVLQGKTVLYFDLEEIQGRKFMRFYKAIIGRIAIALGIDNNTVKILIRREEASRSFKMGTLNKLLEKYAETTEQPVGKLLFTRHEPHTLTTGGMRQVMENMTMVSGENIDVTFVDYPDLLRINEGNDIYRAVGIMFEEIRAIAQEYETVMWTATQLGRKSDKTSSIRTGHDMQGSIQKKNAVEFLGVINITQEEYDEGYGRIYIDKSRNGSNTGQMIPFKVDKLTGLVRAETQNENQEHEQILATKNNTAPTREAIALGASTTSDDIVKGLI